MRPVTTCRCHQALIEHLEARSLLSLAFGVDNLVLTIDQPGLEFRAVASLTGGEPEVGAGNTFLADLRDPATEQTVIGRASLLGASVRISTLTDLNDQPIAPSNAPRILGDGSVAVMLSIPEDPSQPFSHSRRGFGFIPSGATKPNRVELLDAAGPAITVASHLPFAGAPGSQLRIAVTVSDTDSFLNLQGVQISGLAFRGAGGQSVPLQQVSLHQPQGAQKASGVFAFDATFPVDSHGQVQGGPYKLYGTIRAADLAGNVTELAMNGISPSSGGVWSEPFLPNLSLPGGVTVQALRSTPFNTPTEFLDKSGTKLLLSEWKEPSGTRKTNDWYVVDLSTRAASRIQQHFPEGSFPHAPTWFDDGSVEFDLESERWIGSAGLSSFSKLPVPTAGSDPIAGPLVNSKASQDGRVRLWGVGMGGSGPSATDERRRLWASIDGGPLTPLNVGDDHLDDGETPGSNSRQTYRKNDPIGGAVLDAGLTTLADSLAWGLARVVRTSPTSANVYTWQLLGIGSSITVAQLNWGGGSVSITRPTVVDSGNLVVYPSKSPVERLFMSLVLPDGSFLSEYVPFTSPENPPALLRVSPLGTRPVVFLPGIVGSWPRPGEYNEWLMNLGTAPDKLELDPLVRTYDDLMRSLELHGYRSGETLFAAPYDWRVPWAPTDDVIDGRIQTGLTPDRLIDAQYQYGIDYLGDALRRASASWRAKYGRPLDAVDLVAHSMGGLVARSYIQSDVYGGILSSGEPLPIINELVTMGTPHQGASKAWNIINGNFIADDAYKVVFAGVSFDAFNRVFDKNQVVRSSFGAPIDQAAVIAQATKAQYRHLENVRLGSLAVPYGGNQVQLHAAFMDLFAPAGASLTAVYDFIYANRRDGVWAERSADPETPLLGNVNDDPDRRNLILLDLNAGDTAKFDPLLRQWRFDDWIEVSQGPTTVVFPDPTAVPPRNLFAERARTTVIASTSLPTLSLVRAIKGPRQRDGDVPPAGHGASAVESVFFMERGSVRPNEDWVWFMDLYPWRSNPVGSLGSGYAALQQSLSLGAFGTTEGFYFGDATVPSVSGLAPFVADPRVKYFNINDPAADHGGLMQHRDAQKYALRMLGIDVHDSSLSTGSQRISFRTVGEVISLLRDPVEGFLVDDQGRRLGWSAATGHVTEIPNSLSFGDGDGIAFVFSDAGAPMNLTLRLTGSGGDPFAIVTRSGAGKEAQVYSYRPDLGQGQSFEVRVPNQPAAPQTPADDFILLFNSRAVGGLYRGDAIVPELKSLVPDAAFGQGYWGGTNYWFQDAIGDVWSLWHGGPVHASTEFPGQHDWLLTNLTDAAGLSGEFGFDPGSLSGIATGWNAFNIQGVADGKLSALWWSPGGSAGQYIDTDGQWKQGLALGRRANGWVLSSISDALVPATEGITLPGPLRPFSESQSNGRTTFDPRPARAITNDGMSIVVVDTSDRVYVVSFSVWQRPIAGANPALDRVWVVEPIALVPSISDFQLGPQIPKLMQDYVAMAN